MTSGLVEDTEQVISGRVTTASTSIVVIWRRGVGVRIVVIGYRHLEHSPLCMFIINFVPEHPRWNFGLRCLDDLSGLRSKAQHVLNSVHRVIIAVYGLIFGFVLWVLAPEVRTELFLDEL